MESETISVKHTDEGSCALPQLRKGMSGGGGAAGKGREAHGGRGERESQRGGAADGEGKVSSQPHIARARRRHLAVRRR
ncbi:unnamed protein product [Closterium sp. NIES-64]|nr:unnamed protein product [Closterium sp. NIES-64]